MDEFFHKSLCSYCSSIIAFLCSYCSCTKAILCFYCPCTMAFLCSYCSCTMVPLILLFKCVYFLPFLLFHTMATLLFQLFQSHHYLLFPGLFDPNKPQIPRFGRFLSENFHSDFTVSRSKILEVFEGVVILILFLMILRTLCTIEWT